MKRTRAEIRAKQRFCTSSEMTGRWLAPRPALLLLLPLPLLLIFMASWKTSSTFSTTSICTNVAPYRCKTSTEKNRLGWCA